jgi:hypothetical protein
MHVHLVGIVCQPAGSIRVHVALVKWIASRRE